MDIKITRPAQGGVVRAVSSKSEAHRLLICAAFADGGTFVSCPDRGEDVNATVRCLRAIGAGIEFDDYGYSVTPADRRLIDYNKEYALDCGESGATLRFMLPICGALGLRAAFYMRGRLPQRPLTGLYDAMAVHGCKLSTPGLSPLTCQGQLTSGKYALPGDISSQFISGLLLALPLLPGDSEIEVTGGVSSRPYIDMTIDALRLFGFDVPESGDGLFSVPGGRTGRSPKTATVGGDWSNAAFWLALGAIGSDAVTCTGLDPDSRQGDKSVALFLERFGARVACSKGGVTVAPGMLRGIEIDAGDTPDLVPALACVAAVAEGETVIRNAGRLRAKESDRINSVAALLSALGADITETGDGLVIRGKKELSGGETHSFGDHRIVMAAAVIASRCAGPVTIIDAEAVKKSYPYFFLDYCAGMGGGWEEF